MLGLKVMILAVNRDEKLMLQQICVLELYLNFEVKHNFDAKRFPEMTEYNITFLQGEGERGGGDFKFNSISSTESNYNS